MKFKKVSGIVLGTLLVAYGVFLAACGVAVVLTDIPEVTTLLGVVNADSLTADKRVAHLFLGALLSFVLAFVFLGTAYFSSEEEPRNQEEIHG